MMMTCILLDYFALMMMGFLYIRTGNIRFRPSVARYARQTAAEIPIVYLPRTCRKPDWVKHEVLRLKNYMGKAGCRTVAVTFNRLHGRQVTIGKTYVAETIQHNQYQLACLKREIRSRKPYPATVNAVWGLDLTFKTDNATKLHSILGIIDHGSRLVVCLTTLLNKRSWTLLGHLCLAIGRYGKPNAVRTDNEIIFNSWVFRTFLKLAGIRHQQTQVCAPWQNGRIERLFGTLKPLLNQLIIPGGLALQMVLSEFTLFYNHVRPHQNLEGLTPAEVWQGKTMADVWQEQPPKVQRVEALDGLMVGYYLRR